MNLMAIYKIFRYLGKSLGSLSSGRFGRFLSAYLDEIVETHLELFLNRLGLQIEGNHRVDGGRVVQMRCARCVLSGF